MEIKKTTPAASAPEQLVRISFTWFVGGIIAVTALGLLGGVAAQQLFQPPLPPLGSDTGERLVTTVQQVTISPNKAVADVVDRTHRSVVALARQDGAMTRTIVGSGVVVTNDGVIASTGDSTGEVVAIDYEGRSLPLERIGKDALYGISYFRVTDNVVVPLDLRTAASSVGQDLLVVARQMDSFLPRVRSFRVHEYKLPEAGTPVGIQQLMQGTALGDIALQGSPLIDEEGNVAGLVLNAALGTAVPGTHLQQSLMRLSGNQREANPFAELGFTVNYDFRALTPGDKVVFVAEVSTVSTNSIAAAAGLAAGDAITHIAGEMLAWDTNVAEGLDAALPLAITVRRGTQEHSLTLAPRSAPARVPGS